VKSVRTVKVYVYAYMRAQFTAKIIIRNVSRSLYYDSVVAVQVECLCNFHSFAA